jgi:hypothetical protein
MNVPQSIAVFVNAIDHQRSNSKVHVGVVNFWAIYHHTGKGERLSPGQLPLPGWQYQVSKINNEQVSKVAELFILANRGVSS